MRTWRNGRRRLGGASACFALALTSALLLSACSALVSADPDDLGRRPAACDPGTNSLCPCPDGSESLQTCTEGGSFEPCQCQGGSAGAGAVAGSAG